MVILKPTAEVKISLTEPNVEFDEKQEIFAPIAQLLYKNIK